ncbi:MAG: hypothetical protein M3112_09080 [Actinomycetia bacterium]|nr:hypothetical protein [Actinomycetes bacterium]
MAFEVVEFREPTPQEGRPYEETQQTIIGTFEVEAEAIDCGRSAWTEARTSGTNDVMWWIVRVPGETLCRWIADRGSEEEQILDLTTNSLIPLRR